MGKTIIEAPRGEATFLVDPGSVRIIGVDTSHKQGEHPLWQKRAFRGPKEESVLSMMKHGSKHVPEVVIELAEDGGWDLADGRGRVIDAREANRRLAAEGLPQFKLRARVKRREDDLVSLERMAIPNSFGTSLTLMDRIRDAHEMKARGMATEDICGIAGVGPAQIEQWEVVANASREIQDALESGAIGLKVAVSIAMKPPAQQKRALELALGGGKPLTRRQIAQREGKTLPPTRKDLRHHIKALDERREAVARSGGDGSAVEAASSVLRWAYEGGELPAVLRADRPTKRPKRPVVEELAHTAVQELDDAIVAHGLTDRATKVFDPNEPDIETVASRMERAGFHIAAEDLSKRCVAMHRAGRIERSIGGYRRKRAESEQAGGAA